MDHRAGHLLRSFADAAKKPTLSAHDWQAFYRLAVHVHRHSLNMSGLMLSFRLIALGLPHQQAERLGADFDHYRELLTVYDQERP